MQGGYAESVEYPFQSGFPPKEYTGKELWLASLYSSTTQAQSFLDGTVKTLQGDGYPAAGCGTMGACRAFTISWTDAQNQAHTALYGIERTGNVVGEYALDAFADSKSTYGAIASDAFAGLAAGADKTLQIAMNGGAAPSSLGTTPPALSGAETRIENASSIFTPVRNGRYVFEQGSQTLHVERRAPFCWSG